MAKEWWEDAPLAEAEGDDWWKTAPLDGSVKPGKSFGDVAKDSGIALARGIIGLPEAALGVADLVTGGQAGKLAESAGFRPKEAKNILAEYYSPQQAAANAEVNNAKGFMPTIGAMLRNPSTIANQALESAPSMLAGGAISRGVMAAVPAIGPITAGAIGEGAVAAGQNSEQVRQEEPTGTLTPKQAAILAASGALTGGISLASGKLANKLGISDLQTMMASGKLGAVGPDAIASGAQKGLLRKTAEGVLTEGVGQELGQSYQEQVGQNLAQGKPWDEGAAQAGAQGMLVGGLMGGGSNIISHFGESHPTTSQTPEAIAATITSPDVKSVDEAIAISQAALSAGQSFQDLGIRTPAEDLQRQKSFSESGNTWQDIAAQQQIERERQGAISSKATDARLADIGKQWQDLGIRNPADDLAAQRAQALAPETLRQDAINNTPTEPVDAPLSEVGRMALETQKQAGWNTDWPFIPADLLASDFRKLISIDPSISEQEKIQIFDSGKKLGVVPADEQPLPPQEKPLESTPAETVETTQEGSPQPEPAAPALTARQAALRGEIERAKAKSEELKAARVANAKPVVLSVGRMQNGAEPVTVKDGAIYIGKYPAQNFDTGEDVAIHTNATPQEIAQALRDSGAIGPHSRIFGLEKPKPIAAIPVSQRATAQEQIVPTPDLGHIGRDNTPILEGGNPFQDKTDAQTAKKQQPMMRVLKVDGGFVLAPKTEKQLAAEQAAAKRLSIARTGQPGVPIAAHEFIAGEGGLNPIVRSDLGVEGNPRIGNRSLYARKDSGLTLEQATQKLLQDGYLKEGQSQNEALALIKRSLTNPQYTPEGYERMAEAQRAQEYQDHLKAEQEAAQNEDLDPFQSVADLGFELDDAARAVYNEAADPIKVEVNALLAHAESLGIDTDTIKEQDHEDTRNGSEQDYFEASRDALKAAIEASNGNSRENAGEQGAARSEEGLTSPTRQDVLDQQARQEGAAALDEKAQIGKESAGQTLTRPVAPEQRRDTSVDMFAQEKAQAEIDKRNAGQESKSDANQGTMFSKGETRNPSTITVVQSAITEFLGGKQLKSGLGRIVATTSDQIKSYWEPLLDKSINIDSQDGTGKAQGFFDPKTKTVFLIADHIEAGTEQAVAAHEMMHKHGIHVLGESGWNRLHGVIDGWKQAEAGSQEREVYDYASSHVEASGDLSTQELFPYAVEGAIKLGIKPSMMAKQGTVARWLESVRQNLKVVWDKITGKPETFKAQDLVNLAFGIAQRENHDIGAINEPMTNEDVVGNQGGRSADDMRKGATTPDLSDDGMQERSVSAVSGSKEPAQSVSGAGSRSNNTPFREVDLFGNGTRVQYFDDKRGLFYESQRYPSGKVGWKAGEVVDGQTQWLSDKDYPSMEDAIKSVRSQRAINTRKANFQERYGDIPKTWKGEAKKVAMAVIDAGHSVDRFSSSTQTNSKYLYLENGEKIRLAGHDLPGSYEQADYDFRYGGDIAKLVDRISNEPTAPESGGAMYSKTLIVGDTGRYTPEQLRAMTNIGQQVTVPTIKERYQSLVKDFGKKMIQGTVDQFAPLKELGGTAYTLTRLAKGASGAFETLLHGGKLKLTQGVYDFDESQKGGFIDQWAIPLQGEHHDVLRWIAANRAEGLMAEGRENLFIPEDIKAFKALSDGVTNFDYKLPDGTITRDRTKIYADALKTFNGFQKNVMDMYEQSGGVDPEARKAFEREFYLPFYRVTDEDGGLRGGAVKSGIVRQDAIKALKGGKEKLNFDLLDNTLLNWASLLDAAAKNRAAKSALDTMSTLGKAVEAPESTARDMANSIGRKDGVVWYMDQGKKRFFIVDDPYLLTAVTALDYAGMRGPIMNTMSAFKHVLTVGVTSSPFFKVRNLIRDSVQAIASGPLDYNPAKNISQGWKLTDPKSDTFFRLLAGGGTIHFATMYEGSEAKRVQALVDAGVDQSTILNSDQKLKAFYRKGEKLLAAYNELGNRGEAVNRAALYDQLIKSGVGHAEASLQARDLMDFSMQGSFATVRFLTQVVPFMNARLQGLHKLGRAAKDDPARFATVLGATALFSLGLLASYHDDDDWKKRTDADRNNFWWFKFGGVAYRIPKPFEVGAMATLAERSAEYLFDKEMTGKRFRQQILNITSDQLSMNPIPQAVKPILDIYANKDSFTGMAIESMGMDRLQPEYRFNDRTSMLARGLSTAGNALTRPLDINFLSPVQIDQLVKGYFSWLGTFIVSTADIIARPATGQPEQAKSDLWKLNTGNMVSDLRDAPSRYVSQMYNQAKEIEQAYGTWRALQKEGKAKEAAEFLSSNRADIMKYKGVERIKSADAKFNERIRMIERSAMDPDRKREQIREINLQKDRLARLVSQ